MPGDNRHTARRAASRRSTAMPAEPVAVFQSRTAPSAPHATLPALSTLTLVKPYVSDIVGADGQVGNTAKGPTITIFC